LNQLKYKRDERIYESIKVSNGKYIDVRGSTPIVTPNPFDSVANLGVGLNRHLPSFIDTVHHVNLFKIKCI
jgi:hypothetical protein